MVTEVVDGAKTNTDVTLGDKSKQTPTYTEEQVKKAVLDAKTSVLAEAGRYKAEAEKALAAATKAQERLAQLEKERQEAELESARDNPDKLTAIQVKQQLRANEFKLAKAEEELNNTNARLAELTNRDKESSRESTVKEVAKKMGVSPVTLAKMAKFTDGTAEAIEDIAKELPKESNNNNLNPDHNRSHGGAPQTELEIRKSYIEGKITATQRDEKLKAIGARL